MPGLGGDPGVGDAGDGAAHLSPDGPHTETAQFAPGPARGHGQGLVSPGRRAGAQRRAARAGASGQGGGRESWPRGQPHTEGQCYLSPFSGGGHGFHSTVLVALYVRSSRSLIYE